jgi:hypothetical protein
MQVEEDVSLPKISSDSKPTDGSSGFLNSGGVK